MRRNFLTVGAVLLLGANPAPRQAKGTRLEAIVQLVKDRYDWKPGDVFGIDGKLVPAGPRPRGLQSIYSATYLPADPLVAVFHLLPMVSEETPARIDGFVSGETPGKGVRERLAPGIGTVTDRADVTMAFGHPGTRYVQFVVRYGDGAWRKAGEIPVPQVVFPLVRPEERAEFEARARTMTTFRVCLRSYGQADLSYEVRDAAPVMSEGLVKWSPDETARVVARLKSGERVVLRPNSTGTGGTRNKMYATRDADFSLTADSGAVYGGFRGGPPGILLSDVEAFEIETLKFGEPTYVPARLPPPR